MVKNKKIKEVKCYSLSGMANLKGFIKNGLDSSTLINLIIVFDSEFKEFKNKGFTFPPNLFYYHEISRPETIGVLINRCNFSKKEAISAFDKMINQFGLRKIKRKESIDKDYELLVEDANERVFRTSKDSKLKIGIQDIIIIGGFMREKINLIHSGDRGFLKTCEELNLQIIPMPKRDIEKENEIKKWANNRK